MTIVPGVEATDEEATRELPIADAIQMLVNTLALLCVVYLLIGSIIWAEDILSALGISLLAGVTLVVSPALLNQSGVTGIGLHILDSGDEHIPMKVMPLCRLIWWTAGIITASFVAAFLYGWTENVVFLVLTYLGQIGISITAFVVVIQPLLPVAKRIFHGLRKQGLVETDDVYFRWPYFIAFLGFVVGTGCLWADCL